MSKHENQIKTVNKYRKAGRQSNATHSSMINATILKRLMASKNDCLGYA